MILAGAGLPIPETWIYEHALPERPPGEAKKLIVRPSVKGVDPGVAPDVQRISGSHESIVVNRSDWVDQCNSQDCSGPVAWVVQDYEQHLKGVVMHLDTRRGQVRLAVSDSIERLCAGDRAGSELKLDLDSGRVYTTDRNLDPTIRIFVDEIMSFAHALLEIRLRPYAELELVLTTGGLKFLQLQSMGEWK